MPRKALTLGVTLLLALGTNLVIVSSPALATEPKCTITGTAKADTLVGTSAADVICGLGGNDRIHGLSGSDILLGGAGNDYLVGADGNDTLDGGPGNDILEGLNQDDRLNGGAGNDRILGGAGTDQIEGGTGNDFADGGQGLDTLKGDDGNDDLRGAEDRDLIHGGNGSDKLQGGDGDDNLDGGKSRDTISSGEGRDTCSKDTTDVHTDECSIDTIAPVLEPTAQYVRQLKAGDNLSSIQWLLSDQSGVNMSWASIGGAPGWITGWCGFGVVANRLSGDEYMGSYGLDCKIPEDAVNGEYSLFVNASDRFGNTTIWGATFVFTVSGGSDDNAAPQLKNIEVSGQLVAGGKFSITMSFEDETGIQEVYAFIAAKPGGFWDGAQYATAVGYPVLIEGDSKKATYRQDFVFRENLPSRNFEIWLGMRDTLGNKEFITSGQQISLVP
ncbi:MAG: calcium-binding protein [Rhodoluna sp.]